MKTTKFKTNINCGGCVNAVSQALKSDSRILSFEVDTSHPDKILTVQGELSAADIAAKVNSAGFDAKEIQ
jgi:copper chaperone